MERCKTCGCFLGFDMGCEGDGDFVCNNPKCKSNTDDWRVNFRPRCTLVPYFKPDGRALRHIDCNWNNHTNVPNGCTTCRVCRYLEFQDYASSVAPAGSIIDRDRDIENYLGEKDKNKKLELLYKILDKVKNN